MPDEAAFAQVRQKFPTLLGTWHEQDVKQICREYRQLANRAVLADVLPIIEKWEARPTVEKMYYPDSEVRQVVEAFRKLRGE